MSEEPNNSIKLSKLLEEKQYSEVLEEIKHTPDVEHSVHPLIFIKLYCKICLDEFRSARILTNKELKKNPNHELLLSVSRYLNTFKSDNHQMNPLTEFVESFIQLNTNMMTHISSADFDKLMHQILIKPYIK